VKTAERPVAKLRRLFLRRSVPYALFAIACGLSGLASWYLSWNAQETAESRARAEFHMDAQQTRRQLQSGLNGYLEVVRAGAVLVSTDNEINGSEFRRFVNRLELRERHPAMGGIGFAQCVERRNAARVLRLLDLDGNRVRLWPNTDRDEQCAVIFLEPARRGNRALLGFDLASDPVLRDAMSAARDTGQPSLSQKLTDLRVWNADGTIRVIAIFPVYRAAMPDATPDARRRALIGFVFSPFDTQRLIEHVVGLTIPWIAFEVYDGPRALGESTLARTEHAEDPARYESAETVQVAGREWLVLVKSLADATPVVPQGAEEALLGGLVLSFMLFIVTRAQVRAWETAARHEAELRVSAEALKQREAQANAANRAKDEFLATLSHELRTPLNVVLGWVGMLRLGTLAPDRAAKALEIIERNARQQAELIDDLLDVSRITTGKLRLNLQPVDFAAVVAAVIESLRPGADAKGVELQVTPMPLSASVLGDPDRLRQTVWNLLSNAVKFTPGGGTVFVQLTVSAQDVRLTIRDTGIGIPSEFLPHVFERFRQADSSTTREHSGVGLGLAIVRELVELHGGTVQAHSSGTGEGATFVLTLPATAAPQTAAAAAAARTSLPPLDGIRVLVVDDDPNTLEMLTEALRSSGAMVTAADSARRALDRLAETRADVIVSDIAMPGEDGLWLMRHVRTMPGRPGQTPAVALTALARSDDRARAIKAGFQMHIAKPVRLHDLQTVIAALASGAAQPHGADV
jgi:signal transduction histidine kinase/ActR/RegA family two-component response regulator